MGFNHQLKDAFSTAFKKTKAKKPHVHRVHKVYARYQPQIAPPTETRGCIWKHDLQPS